MTTQNNNAGQVGTTILYIRSWEGHCCRGSVKF